MAEELADDPLLDAVALIAPGNEVVRKQEEEKGERRAQSPVSEGLRIINILLYIMTSIPHNITCS